MRVHHPLRTLKRLLIDKAPIEAQLIVTRRCNLSCGYCTEYDGHSPEIPYEILCERIDALHRLRVINIAMLGGEPLLHSRIADVVAYAGRRAQASITTNGFLISDELIDALNEAGLANMQVSIDALRVDRTRYIQKTLRPLLPKLERLAARAAFDVHLTVVLCEETREELLEMLDELRRFPFWVSLNLIHDDGGAVQVGGPAFADLWERFFAAGRAFSYVERDYGRRLLSGERPDWQCRAGSRFLYVDERGRVQHCSAQRGKLDVPVTEYSREDLRRQHRARKGCEKGCAIFCVYRDSMLDNEPISLARSFFHGVRKGILGKPPVAEPAPGRPGRPLRKRVPELTVLG